MSSGKMVPFERKLWRLSPWAYYSIAVVTALLMLILRGLAVPWFGERGVFLFATLPVAISAFLGGLGPGMLAGIIGLLGTVYFFVPPYESLAIVELSDRVNAAGFGLVWVFISVICDFMRRSAIRLSEEMQSVEEHRYQLDCILSSITDGFFSVDRDWKIQHANGAFAQIVGRSMQDVNGAYLWDYFQHPLHYETRIKMTESMRTGEPFTNDFRNGEDGHWYHIRGYPMDSGMFVYVQDITYRKQLEGSREKVLAAEREARNEAEGMNRMKDEFVATLSHELRTPLTTILGWTEVLRRRPNIDAKSEEGLAVIERSVRHQTQLIADLLDMSRIATGKLKLDLEYVDLADTAREAVELARPNADSKGVELVIDVLDENTIVRGDEQRLYQVLTNLISNAVKFTPSGGKVEVILFSREGNVHCQVVDTGEGIEPQFLPYLFDRFRQGDASATRRHGGLGLGLSIVKQLVDLQGGTVSAKSEGKDKGSRFEVTFPMASVPATMLFENETTPAELPSLAGIRVLAVDDDEGTRHLLQHILEEAGAIVVTARSGEDALTKLDQSKFDAILSDIGMPDMDGYQFLRMARRKLADKGLPPAIALTAFAHERDFVLSAEAGFIRHLTKPVDTANLLKTIQLAVQTQIES